MPRCGVRADPAAAGQRYARRLTFVIPSEVEEFLAVRQLIMRDVSTSPDMTKTTNPRIRAVAKFFFEGDRKFFVKGVTYGPFKPDASGNYLGTREQAARDLAQIRESGFNVVRVYHCPPRWFLDACAEAGVRALITLPWAKHIEFLSQRSARNEIIRSVSAAIKMHASHPAIFAYLVGNEIAPQMIRWLGVRRVTEFVEHLINISRNLDSRPLFSYATYPPTEFLLPQNVDFFCFN